MMRSAIRTTIGSSPLSVTRRSGVASGDGSFKRRFARGVPNGMPVILTNRGESLPPPREHFAHTHKSEPIVKSRYEVRARDWPMAEAAWVGQGHEGQSELWDKRRDKRTEGQ